MTLHVQFVTAGLMFSSGLMLGIFYDSYQVLSGQLRIYRWIKPLLDLMYWLAATLFVFRVLYFSNHGQVRVFIFLVLLIGVCFYFAFLSRWIVKLIYLLIKITKTVFRVCKRVFELCVVKPIVGLYRLTVIILGFLAVVCIFIFKIVIKCLYPLWFIIRPLVRLLQKYLKIPKR